MEWGGEDNHDLPLLRQHQGCGVEPDGHNRRDAMNAWSQLTSNIVAVVVWFVSVVVAAWWIGHSFGRK
jgi:hypothetical protein